MDFHQLKTFYTVAKHKNFTRASKELAISQPAVSRQIESLEKYFDLTLFHRVGRHIELTDAGKTLYTMGEQILALVQKTSAVLDGMKNLESGSLQVGASTTIGNYFMVPVVMKFMERYPGIQLNLDIKSTTEIQQQIERNLLDIAIVPEIPSSQSLVKESFLNDDIVLIAPKSHSLTMKKDVTLKDVSNEKLIVRGVGSNTRKTIEEHFKKHNVELNPAVELGSTEAIKQAVIAGGGISFLPKITIESELKLNAVEIVEGRNLILSRKFFIVHHKDSYPSPAVKAFIDFLIKKNDLV
ncbi:LysR family transcriptional regulator [Pseudalkalibacillus sp. R45]|uniref:LysR family transcriptional regulator n=1 Tax=Pseudalkalibacillus sp. R45 TaxID=3457433 RepID=UPI003FCC384F